MNNDDYIVSAFKEMGFSTDEKIINNFLTYEEILIEWNEKMNLTAITEHEEVVQKHFIDSLCGHGFIKDFSSVIDVGTGAGFPGLPLKIYNDTIDLTLVDSLNKRIKFLDEVIEKTNLKNVNTNHARSEDFLTINTVNSYDVAVSRAVANLSLLTTMCLPFVKVGGLFLAYKGRKANEELLEADEVIKEQGGKVIEVYRNENFPLDHNIIVIEKVKETKIAKPKKKKKR